MEYRRVSEVVNAEQWNRLGDLSEDKPLRANGEGRLVQAYHREGLPDTLKCNLCGKAVNEHGWIDPPAAAVTNPQIPVNLVTGEQVIPQQRKPQPSTTASPCAPVRRRSTANPPPNPSPPPSSSKPDTPKSSSRSAILTAPPTTRRKKRKLELTDSTPVDSTIHTRRARCPIASTRVLWRRLRCQWRNAWTWKDSLSARAITSSLCRPESTRSSSRPTSRGCLRRSIPRLPARSPTPRNPLKGSRFPERCRIIGSSL